MMKDKNKLLITCIAGIIIIIVIIYSIYNNNTKDEIDIVSSLNNVSINTNTISEKPKIIIHISGEVIKPGVIKLDEGSRIADAISFAGGITENADLRNVNLAYELQDGQKVYIPSIEDEEAYIIQNNRDGIIVDNNGQADGKININKATASELSNLDGIGYSIAQRIVLYRETNGNFKSIEELKNVSGIGESKYNQIKEKICL